MLRSVRKRGELRAGSLVLLAVGVAACSRQSRPMAIRSGCRSSRPRTCGSSISIRSAISCRTRCAPSPTRSPGSAASFDWAPSESTTVLLKDFSDYGSRPRLWRRRTIGSIFDIAPLSHAFETYPASERMYSLMNHELVHVATGDIASEEERRWRRFFLGKVSPQRGESGVAALQLPHRRRASRSPRWYLEGSAVFMETWMGGGVGRAQGGYDEMVFRAMVRDDAHFYDPLGSCRAASASISRSAPTRTSTARASSPGSPTPIRPRRWSHG